jgi:hypothetical protein
VRALDEIYRIFLAPYLRFAGLVWCGFGLWCVIRPAMLDGPYGALVLNRDVARAFGLSPAFTERVLSISELVVIRVIVQAVILAEIAFMLVATWKCNRDLRRIAASS